MSTMKRQICAEVQSWLATPAPSAVHDMPTSLRLHIESCEHCRGALTLLIADLSQQDTAQETYVSCGECQMDLAAYIDLVQAQGETTALRRYPQVWSHLLSCQECAETYEMTTALVQAEANGEIPSLHSVFLLPDEKKTVSFHPTFVLSRSYLLQSVSHIHMGFTREADPLELSLVDQDIHRYGMHVTVSPIDNDICQLIIATQPAATGHVTVSVDDFVMRALIDERGVALLPTFPLKLLQDSTKADLIIKLEA